MGRKGRSFDTVIAIAHKHEIAGIKTDLFEFARFYTNPTGFNDKGQKTV
jgi:hypothetical protein